MVNTASKCALTSQYEELQALYEQYGGDGSGMVVDFTSPRESPNSEKIVNWIKSNNL